MVEKAQTYLHQQSRPGIACRRQPINLRGMYENQVRARRTLALVLPLSLFVIFLISVPTVPIHHPYPGYLSWAYSPPGPGGFILLWLYGQPWFLGHELFGVNLRELFQMGPVNLSVAVWVGFLALFGIATDDGVVMMTYLDQSFRRRKPANVKEIRETALEAGARRLRPCLMTSATTILALIPVLTSTGRGSDVMIPMAIPSVGGMTVLLLTLFVTPVLYAAIEEIKLFLHLLIEPSSNKLIE